MNVRTPGWSSIPSYWGQTARFLQHQSGQNAAWVVPGTGFGIQTWGWTMDEPMSMVGLSPWVTRSQVPLVGAETIRMLSSLEDVLDTGSGSAHLGEMLQRAGLGFVVLRHDLDPDLADASPSSVVSIALARSSGVTRVATFGALDFGPAIEVFEVSGRDRSQRSD
jgi:arabinofuranan 3-O-arabinosyltransferase